MLVFLYSKFFYVGGLLKESGIGVIGRRGKRGKGEE